MEKTKVHFSEEELELIHNSDFILTKNRIIEKIGSGFEDLAYKMQDDLQHIFSIPADVLKSGFKVSKGEKYKGLPYLILDCPRLFGKEDIFALRTMFWWGNYFSITLHVKGRFLSQVKQSVARYLPLKKENELFISFSGDEWNHDINEKAYLKLSKLNLDELKLLHADGFFKLSKKIKLGDWKVVEEELYSAFREIMGIISA